MRTIPKAILSLSLLRASAGDILSSPLMQSEKLFIQHGTTSCFAHSVSVALLSLALASHLHLAVEQKSMIRGALLHDFYLYDWHIKDKSHRLHGYTHPARALQNARENFPLSGMEEEIIKKHMFPLTLSVPRCREGLLVCLADKICALRETRLFSSRYGKEIRKEV